ncbi:hypothetical protein [Ralstonia sp. 24A2]|uniref:hypothetical protein n=1 Tax=Ralstonia sp. 24A2 TaxID=3447364 RepID=UPI003F69C67E
MRTPLPVAVLLALALPSTAALALNISVKNETNNCAWITVYSAVSLMPWNQQDARFIKPGAVEDFRIARKADLRVRAEVKSSAECGNTPNVADVHDWRKGLKFTDGPNFDARVVKTGDGKFHLWIHD